MAHVKCWYVEEQPGANEGDFPIAVQKYFEKTVKVCYWDDEALVCDRKVILSRRHPAVKALGGPTDILRLEIDGRLIVGQAREGDFNG